MTSTPKNNITPGGRSTHQKVTTRHSDSGGLASVRKSESERSDRTRKRHTYMGTMNIQTLIQAGKLHKLTEELQKQKILILALQETRFTDTDTIDSGKYRLFKGGTTKKICKGAAALGMAFVVHNDMLERVKEVKTHGNRLMTIRIKHANKHYTMINVHAPTNNDNKGRPEETDKFWERLERIVAEAQEDDTKILLGDFNAQLGKERKYRKTIGDYPAHKRTNRNGIRLVELCQQHNMKIMSTSFRKNPRKQKTWRSPITEIGEFQIDHVAISYKCQREIHNIQVRKGANIDSDHYLTRIKIKMTPKRRARKTFEPRIDLQRVGEMTEIWEQTKANNWPEFQHKVMLAREKIPLTKKPKHPWWNAECEAALETRKKAFQRYASNRTKHTHQDFLEVRRQTAKTIRQEKRKHINNQLDSLEEDFRNYNARSFYRTFANQIKGYTPPNLCFKNEKGELTLNNQESCKELARYFDKLLNCQEPKERLNPREPVEAKESTPITRDEVIRHIKKLKNGKAAGEDGITAELLKNLGDNSINEITKIMQDIWETETIPDQWKTALIYPLHKKGDRTDVNNYRGISLLPVTYKILSACLLERAQKQLEPQIAEYQAGFRPGRSCAEQIINLKTILRLQAQKNLVCVFVDFQKAYDSVDRATLFRILEERGLDRKTLGLVKQTLTGTKSKVKHRGVVSEPFEIHTGVRQGDGLSPLMFNLVLDRVMIEWEEETKKKRAWNPIKLGKTDVYVPYLAFADDLAILAHNAEEARVQMETLKECAEKVGLQISFSKTKVMSKIGTPLDTKHGRIEGTKEYRYLGEIIQPTGLDRLTYDDRRTKTRRALGMIRNIYNKKCLSVTTKIKHYNTVIKPATLYASETLALDQKGRLEECKKEERKIIRKIIGARLTEEGYRLQSNETTERYSNIEHDMRKRRLKFYGHIERLPATRLTKKILEYAKSYKNTTKWLTEIRKDLVQAGISDTADRNEYRKAIHNWRVQSEAHEKKQRPKWTEERKRAFSEKMKAHWKKRREKVKKLHDLK